MNPMLKKEVRTGYIEVKRACQKEILAGSLPKMT